MNLWSGPLNPLLRPFPSLSSPLHASYSPLDLLLTLHELIPVPPNAILGISLDYAFWILGVPQLLGRLDFGLGAQGGERWNVGRWCGRHCAFETVLPKGGEEIERQIELGYAYMLNTLVCVYASAAKVRSRWSSLELRGQRGRI